MNTVEQDVAPAAAPAPRAKPARTVGQAYEQAVTTVTQNVNEASANAAAAASKAFDLPRAKKAAEDVAAFNRGNMEAFAQSSQILFSGTQDLYRKVAAFSQAAFSEAMAGFKALAAVKTAKEAYELQSSLAKASVERAVAESSQLAQASLKLAEQVAAPLNERVVLAAEVLTRRATH